MILLRFPILASPDREEVTGSVESTLRSREGPLAHIQVVCRRSGDEQEQDSE